MQSMTGFGRATFEIGERAYRVELRTLNSRFLDIKTRLPWPDGELESKTVGLLRQRIARGRVEIGAWEDSPGSGGRSGYQLDAQAAQDVAAVLHELAKTVGCSLEAAAQLLPPLNDLLIRRPTQLSADLIWQQLTLGIEEALKQVIQMRQREGESARNDLEQRLSTVQRLVREIRDKATDEPNRLQQRLIARLDQLAGVQLDPGRLAQEVAVLAERADVSEELTRLESHRSQLEEMLTKAGPVGRKMEFMLQEVNRELNTVASKTQSADVAAMVVEAKGELEKMREQAQNVE